MKRAIIKKTKKGKFTGQYRFVLQAANNKVIATSGTQRYNQKQSAIETLENNFPDFIIIDKTGEV